MVSLVGVIDSTYYKVGLICKEDFNEGGFQMLKVVYLEVRLVFVRTFLRYINQCTTCRRFCGCLFNVVTRNMHLAGWKVRLRS